MYIKSISMPRFLKEKEFLFQDFFLVNLPRLFELRDLVWSHYNEGLLQKETITINLMFNFDTGLLLEQKLTSPNKTAAKILFPEAKLCIIPLEIHLHKEFAFLKQEGVKPLNFNRTEKNIHYLYYYDRLFTRLLQSYNKININYFKTVSTDGRSFMLFEDYYNFVDKGKEFLESFHL